MAAPQVCHLLKLPDELLLNIVSFIDCRAIGNWLQTCRRLCSIGHQRAQYLQTSHRRWHRPNDYSAHNVLTTLKHLVSRGDEATCIRELYFHHSRARWPEIDWDMRWEIEKYRELYPEECIYPISEEESLASSDVNRFCDLLERHFDLKGTDMLDDAASLRDEVRNGNDKPLKLLCIALAPNLQLLDLAPYCFSSSYNNDTSLFERAIRRITLSDEPCWPPGFQSLSEIKIDSRDYNGSELLALFELPGLKKVSLHLAAQTSGGSQSRSGTPTNHSYAVEELHLSGHSVQQDTIDTIFRHATRLRCLHIEHGFVECSKILSSAAAFRSGTIIELSVELRHLPPYSRYDSDQRRFYHRSLIGNPIKALASLRVVERFPAALISTHFDQVSRTPIGPHRRCLLDPREMIKKPRQVRRLLCVADLREIFPKSLESLALTYFNHCPFGNFYGDFDKHNRQAEKDERLWVQDLARRLYEMKEAGGKVKEVVFSHRFNRVKLSSKWRRTLHQAFIELIWTAEL